MTKLPQTLASKTPGKIGFISLGCAKALVDSEHILTQLSEEGYVLNADYDSADIIVINTCGFIENAVKESMDTINEALARNGQVIVTGCLGGKKDFIKDEFPEVLAVTGPHATHEVLDAIHQHLPPLPNPLINLIPPGGIKLTPRHYAYIKISEGCNHRCKFCIIPSLRGDLVSRPIDDILNEATKLKAAGVKELLIISQDTSAYGLDLKYRPAIWQGQSYKSDINDLCRALGELGLWIRLHYLYPYPHVDKIIPLMAEGKILPYLDIPLQHASAKILKAMRRPANAENSLARIKSWREICPEIKIRSTFIVGYPGETEDDFQTLLDFLQQARLDRVGCFTYSTIDGAVANALPDPVAESLKQERQQQLMEVQAAISAEKLEAMIGKELQVLVDETVVDEAGDNYIIGRSYGEAPEVDGEIICDYQNSIQPGDFINVKIINADEHDLFAQII